MSENTDNKLQQIYELIRGEQLDEAESMLEPILVLEPENLDAWWLKANAATDPEHAREALTNVLSLDNEHPAAQDMLDKLNEIYPLGMLAEDVASTIDFADMLFTEVEGDTLSSSGDDIEDADEEQQPVIKSLNFGEDESSTPSTAVDFETLFDDDVEVVDDADEVLDAEEGTSRRSPFRRVVMILAVVLVAIILVVVLQGMLTGDTPAAVVDNPAADAPEAVADVMGNLEQTANNQSAMLGGSSTVRYEIANDERTIVLAVCRPAGTDISAAMDYAMEIAANAVVDVPDDLDMLAVELMNCERGDMLLNMQTDMASAVAYAFGDASFSEYRAMWEVGS